MSDVQAAPAVIAAPAATETVPAPAVEAAPVVDEQIATSDAAPAIIAAEEAPAAAAADAEVKPIEPINEGLLGYKAPGLLKQFTFAKKDFFFSDEAVAPAQLDLYLRGEKADVAHPVVAYASQSGKGLLFFVKKGETDKSRPAGVLPLYEATDLKKAGQHEFTFRLHNHNHSFKASSDAERDGWYQSIEKSIELGKAQKETVVESEGYKAELQKLSAPSVSPAAVAGVATAGTVAAGTAVVAKKSTDIERVDGAKPAGSDDDEEVKKTKKSRSTSRGLVARLRGKKEEIEAKVEQRLDEHEAEQEAKKAEADAAAAEAAKEETVEETAAPAEEKPKISKRNSIFDSLKGVLTPNKEKDAKDAELKTEAPVAETAPQLPETAAAPAIVEPVVPATETAVAEPAVEAPATETVTPSREKKNFLSGFLNKRDRSVSPSPAKETAAAPAAVEATEPVVAAEPAAETPAAAATTEPVEAVGDVAAAEETPAAAKRQSVFGGLGRRASKMIQRVQSSNKKEAVPAAETKAEETAAVVETPAENDLAAHEATEPVVESKPEAVIAPTNNTVTASA